MLIHSNILSFHNSKECQVQHWKEHKSTCTLIKKEYDIWKEAMNNVLPDGSALDTKEGPCAICLEETITNPVVLPCGHAFCFSCVGNYQQSSTSKEGASCPYCRGEIPNMGMKAVERATLYGDRAVRSSKESEEQKKYAKLALVEFESIMELLDPDGVKEEYIEVLHWKAMMTSMTGQPEETIKITGEVLSLNKKHPGVFNFDKVAVTNYWKAQAYSDCGKWKDSVKIYKSLFMEHKQRGADPSDMMITDYSRALYELQKYDEAILVGKLAIELNRSRPGVHKYVALSQKANGDIDAAAKTMSRAILYEEHWDKDNIQKNKELLRELNNL